MKSIILAIATGKLEHVIKDISGLSWRKPSHPYIHPRLVVQRKGKRMEFIAQRLAASLHQWSGEWDMWQLTPDPGSIGNDAVADDAGSMWATRAYRWLHRAVAKHPALLHGPWSPRVMIDKSPSLADAVLKTEETDIDGNPTGKRRWAVPLLAGARQDDVLAWDYDPSDKEIADDTDVKVATESELTELTDG